jgi:hypothetical protein
MAGAFSDVRVHTRTRPAQLSRQFQTFAVGKLPGEYVTRAGEVDSSLPDDEVSMRGRGPSLRHQPKLIDRQPLTTIMATREVPISRISLVFGLWSLVFGLWSLVFD